MIGSVRKRQTNSRMKYSTGPISVANTDAVPECPVSIRWAMAGTAAFTVR